MKPSTSLQPVFQVGQAVDTNLLWRHLRSVNNSCLYCCVKNKNTTKLAHFLFQLFESVQHNPPMNYKLVHVLCRSVTLHYFHFCLLLYFLNNGEVIKCLIKNNLKKYSRM